MSKKTHGGKRDGAGRPAHEEPMCCHLDIRLTESQLTALQAAARQSRKPTTVTVFARERLLRGIRVDRD